MDPSQVNYPPMKDLTIENITDNVNLINSGCKNPRTKFLIERLVQHIHNYARETRLSMAEWGTAIDFLTKTGQMCTDIRQEFILLSDVIGLSLLVDAIDHPKPKDATEGTVLGPFHTHDALDKNNGESISADEEGTPLLVVCTLKDRQGKPVVGAQVDVWETNSHGFYDVQYAERSGPDGRAVLHSDEEGFWFKGIVPVSYPVPVDGPVGDFLRALNRHPYRPAHVHFMVQKEGFDKYITALTVRGDPYETSDPVFGVKDSLIVDIGEVTDEATAKKYDVPLKTKLLKHDFVLVTTDEAHKLRRKIATETLEAVGLKPQFYENMVYANLYEGSTSLL